MAKTKDRNKNSISNTVKSAAASISKAGADAIDTVTSILSGTDKEFGSLDGLLLNELSDLYSAENQLMAALPKMSEKATTKDLKKAFSKHLKETAGHVKRLNQISKILKINLEGKTCKAMEGLIKEGNEVLSGSGSSDLIDAALIACAQRVEHYEIAAYGCTRAMAKALSLKTVVALLQKTLDEEGATDKNLTRIAEKIVFPGIVKSSSKKKKK